VKYSAVHLAVGHIVNVEYSLGVQSSSLHEVDAVTHTAFCIWSPRRVSPERIVACGAVRRERGVSVCDSFGSNCCLKLNKEAGSNGHSGGGGAHHGQRPAQAG